VASSLLAVPNVSTAEPATVRELEAACAGVRLLDVHSDSDHGRSVFTLAGAPGMLADALLAMAAISIERIDLGSARGQHPRVGAIDVVPLVHVDENAHGAACATALVVADRLAVELDLPVLLYGELGDGRTRAELRRGGVEVLRSRLADGELTPDFGPRAAHPAAGAALVASRPPLVAFNVRLAPPASYADASAVAAALREGGRQGIEGLRAIAVELADGTPQVSMNVERPRELPLARVLAAVRELAAVESAEIVGLVPRGALDGFPTDVPLGAFDPARHVLENALGSS